MASPPEYDNAQPGELLELFRWIPWVRFPTMSLPLSPSGARRTGGGRSSVALGLYREGH